MTEGNELTTGNVVLFRRAEMAVQQLALYGQQMPRVAARPRARSAEETHMCAACRAREARYGFKEVDDDDPMLDRPHTLCFDCFRMEIDRRQAVARQLAHGWNATQPCLPLAGTLDELTKRRRRAQIAARRAVEGR